MASHIITITIIIILHVHVCYECYLILTLKINEFINDLFQSNAFNIPIMKFFM